MKRIQNQGFFWQVPLSEGRYRQKAPYRDVLVILGLRRGSKTAKNSQKWPKIVKNDLIRLLHGKTP